MTKIQDEDAVNRYIESVRLDGGNGYEIGMAVVQQIVADGHLANEAVLDLVTALQRALPSTRDGARHLTARQSQVHAFKGALTNIIIMQTRLNERVGEFLELLKQYDDNLVVDRVPVGPEVVGAWARAAFSAGRNIE